MVKIAYVDHYFHKKTLSTQFVPDILRKHGHTVDLFWDETENSGKGIAFDDVLGYDIILMFQSRCLPLQQYYSLKHDNVILIPMLDQFEIYRGGIKNSCNYWEAFQGGKVLSFSTAVHSIATFFGLRSLNLRYYQAPAPQPSTPKGLHGFFWQRHAGHVSWPLVRKLIGDTRFDSFHIHLAADPYTPAAELPSEEELARHNITMSTWFEDKQDFLAVLQRANVFFCPRAEEGIGQAFLEALARGQCVVSRDNGTMNEYITHGVNGLLFSAEAPAPLDFSRVGELGRNALQSVEAGYARWHEQEERLVDFILTPSSLLYKGYYRHEPMMQEAAAPAQMVVPPLSLRQRIKEWRIISKTRWCWGPVWRWVKSRHAASNRLDGQI